MKKTKLRNPFLELRGSPGHFKKCMFEGINFLSKNLFYLPGVYPRPSRKGLGAILAPRANLTPKDLQKETDEHASPPS